LKESLELELEERR